MTKTITFAITHFSVAFAVAYLLTGNIGVSSMLALVEPMVNTVAYFFHEKIWDRIRAGKPANIAYAGHEALFHRH
ncbi:DUF2061 domain-containing protein [Chitinolyticbacter albus]|uniref:DUF2061 domain-containing protein n=1 Tax=Chitinolyticbacter albus TaxID=2961951 RepID=UPI002108B62D|nr:DUF2061 domain-containing protein [Chitinolyticbacter albus]